MRKLLQIYLKLHSYQFLVITELSILKTFLTLNFQESLEHSLGIKVKERMGFQHGLGRDLFLLFLKNFSVKISLNLKKVYLQAINLNKLEKLPKVQNLMHSYLLPQ